MNGLFIKYGYVPNDDEINTSLLLSFVNTQVLSINKQAYNLDRIGKRDKAQSLYFESTTLLALIAYMQLVKKIYDREVLNCNFSLQEFFAKYKLECVISTVEKHFYKNVGEFVDVDTMLDSIGLKSVLEDYLSGDITFDGLGQMFLTSDPLNEDCKNLFRLL